VHRRDGLKDIYFVRNGSARAVDTLAGFRVTGRQPELWNAVDGSVDLNTDSRVEDGSTRMQLHLAPYGSVFVVFAQPVNPKRSPKLAKTPDVTSFELPLDRWTITFQKDRGAPSGAQKLPGFTSWTEWPDAGVRYFSGTATYRTDFDGRHAAGDRILVALTDLHEICTVRINGKPAGVIWAMLYQLDVTGVLKDGTNTLELDVTNLWPNRILGDAQPSNTHAYTSTNIRKYTASSPLLPSGLIGPVTIQTIRVTGGRTAQAAHLAPHSRLRAQGKHPAAKHGASVGHRNGQSGSLLGDARTAATGSGDGDDV
jgi:hypothetical protein